MVSDLSFYLKVDGLLQTFNVKCMQFCGVCTDLVNTKKETSYKKKKYMHMPFQILTALYLMTWCNYTNTFIKRQVTVLDSIGQKLHLFTMKHGYDRFTHGSMYHYTTPSNHLAM